ncbi:LysM domain-containing protein [Rhizobacter sp. OV335]|uniref:LysM peptidoglycan-binding domain-containing protein n=1 Tax=Rhizobacter sp. OV335 TaxID=1500264 RepID=UPI001160F834|nr:LysM domain-containing protein [Rhizobacter sp. OV335]
MIETSDRTAPSRLVGTAALMTALVAALALSACATKPADPPAEAPATTPVAPAPAPEPPPPPTPAMQAQAQKVAQGVVELLEAGNEEQARAELQRALSLDPANKLALNLQKQMTEDPQATLGRESFPYVVRAGDTLSRIAGRFLGDIYAFHILARYNNIKVPRQVGEGTTIRIPGKAPPPETARPTRPAPAKPEPAAEPAPPPVAAAPAAPAEPSAGEKAFRAAEASAKAGNLERALADYKQAASLGVAAAGPKADATSKRLVDTHSRNARSALARQDLDGAIKSWDKVLELDPANDTAKLERQKALRLKEKVNAL